MPDKDGKFRGITVPRVPWHEEDEPRWVLTTGDPETAIVLTDTEARAIRRKGTHGDSSGD